MKILLKLLKNPWIIGVATSLIAALIYRRVVYSLILKVIAFIAIILFYRIPVYLVILSILVVLLVYKFILTIILRYQNFKVIKALYGAKTTRVDIANQLNNLIVDNKLDTILSNAICGRDPAPHTLKTCEITYQVGNKTRIKKYKETERIKLPKIYDMF